MTNVEFSEIWNQSPSLQAAANVIGMKKVSCRDKAVELRSRGIHLKRMPRPVRSLEERFFSFVSMNTEGCWEWNGAKNNDGYGVISTTRIDGPKLAHRVSFGIHFYAPPDDQDVCHSCDSPGCVNPVHLFVGREVDNIADMIRKRRGWWQGMSPEQLSNELKRRRAGRKPPEIWTDEFCRGLLEGVGV